MPFGAEDFSRVSKSRVTIADGPASELSMSFPFDSSARYWFLFCFTPEISKCTSGILYTAGTWEFDILTILVASIEYSYLGTRAFTPINTKEILERSEILLTCFSSAGRPAALKSMVGIYFCRSDPGPPFKPPVQAASDPTLP